MTSDGPKTSASVETNFGRSASIPVFTRFRFRLHARHNDCCRPGLEGDGNAADRVTPLFFPVRTVFVPGSRTVSDRATDTRPTVHSADTVTNTLLTHVAAIAAIAVCDRCLRSLFAIGVCDRTL